jgi:hypothetical protein
MSLAVGPEGCVYGGAYQSTELFRYDPKAKELKTLGDHHPGWSGETFSYTIWKGELITASYTNGAIVAYDPKKPWKAEIGKMINPRRVGFLGQYVYRPMSICVSEDGRVWAVGPAGWGTTGNGIAWIDPVTGKTEATQLPDYASDILPLPGNRLLTVGSGRLRWWDGTKNQEIAACTPPAPFTSAVLLEPGHSSRILFSSEGELLIGSADTSGQLTIEKRFPCPVPCTRVLPYQGEAVIGGPKGFAVVNLKTGASQTFCSTPIGHRWAFAVTEGAVFFNSGAELMTAPLPGGRKEHVPTI